LGDRPAIFVVENDAIQRLEPAARITPSSLDYTTIVRVAFIGFLAVAGVLTANGDFVPAAAAPSASQRPAHVAAVRTGDVQRSPARRAALVRQARATRDAGRLRMQAMMLARASGGANRDGMRAPPAPVAIRNLGAPILLATLSRNPPEAGRQEPRNPTLWNEATFANPAVLDGRTLTLDGVAVRLAGIEPPRAGEICRTLDGRNEACAVRTATQLELMVRWRSVTCRMPERPRRDIATNCRIGNTDIAQWLVRNGWARPAREDDPRFAQALTFARQQRAGLWREPARDASPTPTAALGGDRAL